MLKKILSVVATSTFFLITTLLLFTAGNAGAGGFGICTTPDGANVPCDLGGGSSSSGSSSSGPSWGSNRSYDDGYQSPADRRHQAEQEAKWKRDFKLADEANEKGNKQFEQKNWDRAIAFYKEALQYNPNDEVIKNNILMAQAQKINTAGVKYYNQGDYENAVALFKEAIQQLPENAGFQDNLRDAEASLKSQRTQNRINDQASGRINDILSEVSQKMNKPSSISSSDDLDFMMIDSSVVDLRDAKTLVVDPSKVSGQPAAEQGSGIIETDSYKAANTPETLFVSDAEKSELRDVPNRASVKAPPRGRALIEAVNDKKKGPGTKASLYYSLALHDISQGDYDNSISLLQKAIAELPDNEDLQSILNYALQARDKKNGKAISNPKVEVLLDALDQGKTWNDSIAILEDKLDKEQDEEKKQFIRDALDDVKTAAATDILQQHAERLSNEEERREVISDEEFKELQDQRQEHSYDQK